MAEQNLKFDCPEGLQRQNNDADVEEDQGRDEINNDADVKEDQGRDKIKQDPKFDCPEDLQRENNDNDDDDDDAGRRYDSDGVMAYHDVEKKYPFPLIPGQYAVLKVTIQNDDFNIPKYLWENYRVYKPRRNEDYTRVYPELECNIAYKYTCFGYFMGNSK